MHFSMKSSLFTLSHLLDIISFVVSDPVVMMCVHPRHRPQSHQGPGPVTTDLWRVTVTLTEPRSERLTFAG